MPRSLRRRLFYNEIKHKHEKRTLAREFCEETSLAGFAYLLDDYGPLIRRLIWGLIMALFTAVTIYQLYEVIDDYLTNPLQVNIERTYDEPLVFPAVTICNMMPFRVSAVRPLSDMHEALTDMYQTPYLNRGEVLRHRDVLEKRDNAKDYLFNVSFQIEDILTYCKWANESCSEADWEPSISPDEVCYTFNSLNTTGGQPRTVERAGARNGLELLLNAETYEQMDGPYTTYGIKGRQPPETAVKVYIGATTDIAIETKRTMFYEGRTCDWRRLSLVVPPVELGDQTVDEFYSAMYSRDLCVYEKRLNDTIQKCRCVPMADDSVTDRLMSLHGVPICNLYLHFICSLPEMTNFVQVSSDVCPEECEQFKYTTTVSQTRTAWQRLEKQLAAEAQNVSKKLRTATEIAKRHVPVYKHEREDLFAEVRNATTVLLHQRNVTNGLVCGMPETLSSPELPALAGRAEEFLISLTTFHEALEDFYSKFNETVAGVNSLLGNDTEKFFLENPVANVTTLDELAISPKYFVISDGNISLHVLNQWVIALEKLVEANKTFAETKYTGYMLPDGSTILRDNVTAVLNSTVDGISNLTYSPGCLDHTVTILDNQSISTLEVTMCIFRWFSSDNSKDNLAESVNDLFYAENEDVPAEADAQEIRCSLVLCKVIHNYVESHNCSITVDDIDAYYKEVLARNLSASIESCQQQANATVGQMNQHIQNYTSVTLAELNNVTAAAKVLAETVEVLSEIFSSPLWPNDTLISYFDANMTHYERELHTYENFSKINMEVFKDWIGVQYGFSWNEVVERLSTVVKQYDLMDKAIQDLHSNNMSYTANETARGTGFYSYVAKYMLWKNATGNNTHKLEDCITTLRNLTQHAIENITIVSSNYSRAVSNVMKDSEKYIEGLVINSNFFRENYMVVNIYFNDIALESTVQESKYDFFTLLSDIGGGSGLFLGFCMVSLVEMMDLGIRHGWRAIMYWCCGGKQRRRRKVHEKRMEEEKSSNNNNDNGSMTNPIAIPVTTESKRL